MSETNINGIDVSEWELKGILIPITECKYFEGIGDCKQSKGLCVANDNCYFKQLKRLQEENKSLQMLSCVNCGEKYLTPDGSELYEKNVQLQEENEELKEKNAILILANSGIEEKNEQLNERVKTFTKPKHYYKGLQKAEEEKDKYKQALEEIRKWATNHNPCDIDAEVKCTKEDCFKCLNYDIKKITETVNEVLNDRD